MGSVEWVCSKKIQMSDIISVSFNSGKQKRGGSNINSDVRCQGCIYTMPDVRCKICFSVLVPNGDGVCLFCANIDVFL